MVFRSSRIFLCDKGMHLFQNVSQVRHLKRKIHYQSTSYETCKIARQNVVIIVRLCVTCTTLCNSSETSSYFFVTLCKNLLNGPGANNQKLQPMTWNLGTGIQGLKLKIQDPGRRIWNAGLKGQCPRASTQDGILT